MGLIEGILRQRRATQPEVAEALEPALEAAPEPETGNGEEYSPVTHIRTRTEAYQLLAEAAEFLARTEPHSPTPYLVRRAVAWGSMPLDQLLPELVRNQNELAEIYRLLNVPSGENPRK